MLPVSLSNPPATNWAATLIALACSICRNVFGIANSMLCLKVCTAQTEWLAEWHATEQLFGFLSLTHTHLVKTDGHLNEDLLCFYLGIPTDYEMVFGW